MFNIFLMVNERKVRLYKAFMVKGSDIQDQIKEIF